MSREGKIHRPYLHSIKKKVERLLPPSTKKRKVVPESIVEHILKDQHNASAWVGFNYAIYVNYVNFIGLKDKYLILLTSSSSKLLQSLPM